MMPRTTARRNVIYHQNYLNLRITNLKYSAPENKARREKENIFHTISMEICQRFCLFWVQKKIHFERIPCWVGWWMLPAICGKSAPCYCQIVNYSSFDFCAVRFLNHANAMKWNESQIMYMEVLHELAVCVCFFFALEWYRVHRFNKSACCFYVCVCRLDCLFNAFRVPVRLFLCLFLSLIYTVLMSLSWNFDSHG